MKKNVLGNYLRNLREKHCLSQPTLAEQLELSNAFINYLEMGKRMPSPATLQKFSNFFKVDLDFLKDLTNKQKLLNKQAGNEDESNQIPEPIQKLSELLLKVEKPLLDELVENFMEQVNTHIIQMTCNFSLTDLRHRYYKEMAFENDSEEEVVVEGFLKLPENYQMFIKFIRLEQVLQLELLHHDRTKIGFFEKWIGPHVFSNLCEIMIPQVTEPQRGMSFYWFSPHVTIQQQLHFLLQQNPTMDSIMINSAQLAWFTRQNDNLSETEYGVG